MSKKSTKENFMEVIQAAEETEGETHMRHFYEAVDAGTQPPAETIQFLADAFKEIHKMESFNGQ